MKKMITATLIALTLVGCASGPEKGYYDQQGVYHPSAEATNADRWTTAGAAGAVAAGAAAVAGLTLGIIAVTK